jgi:carbonic anhydrase/acetyltransferase-like protein (isoleucine patch superfamily)
VVGDRCVIGRGAVVQDDASIGAGTDIAEDAYVPQGSRIAAHSVVGPVYPELGALINRAHHSGQELS